MTQYPGFIAVRIVVICANHVEESVRVERGFILGGANPSSFV